MNKVELVKITKDERELMVNREQLPALLADGWVEAKAPKPPKTPKTPEPPKA